MDIRDLRFFCLTAEMEHVTRAAEKLGVSQPFLTRVISNLEKEIGLALFDNVGRTIRLNGSGENFYIHAKKVLSDMDELEAEVSTMLDRHNKSIRILCNVSAYSPELIVAFRKQHPNYTISIEFAPMKEILNALTIGDADFAFCSPPLIDDPLKGIKTDLVFCERCSVLLPPGHPLADAETVGFEDIKDMQLVTTTKGTGLRINIEQTFKKHDLRPNIVCETNDMNLIIRSVRDGMGYAILPRWLIFSSPALRGCSVDVDVPDAYAYVGISYNTNPSVGAAGTGFKDFAIKFLNEFRLKADYGGAPAGAPEQLADWLGSRP
ncbi:MAG: LysR family transcriptional regulator [Oscillospiraceae bacterium]|nr:LysR family transcriptional regulator [Oscillospiraceae bacterium]